MIEVGCFKSGDNELAYSYAVPSEKAKRIGIIFVHAANGNRLGPHRMYVEFADNLNAMGYPTLRFDLNGCGDSTGPESQDDIISDVRDIVEAIRFLMTKADLESVILLGISRGSRACYLAMSQYTLPLKGLILLSTPISSGRSALKSLRERLIEYSFKLRDPKHLWKLLNGQADIPQIWQTLRTAIQLKNRYAQTGEKTLVSKCPVLFIYGMHDSIAEESSKYYTQKCKENNVMYDCHFIANANHSFFHYKWKEEIFNLSKQWLERISN